MTSSAPLRIMTAPPLPAARDKKRAVLPKENGPGFFEALVAYPSGEVCDPVRTMMTRRTSTRRMESRPRFAFIVAA